VSRPAPPVRGSIAPLIAAALCSRGSASSHAPPWGRCARFQSLAPDTPYTPVGPTALPANALDAVSTANCLTPLSERPRRIDGSCSRQQRRRALSARRVPTSPAWGARTPTPAPFIAQRSIAAEARARPCVRPRLARRRESKRPTVARPGARNHGPPIFPTLESVPTPGGNTRPLPCCCITSRPERGARSPGFGSSKETVS